MIVFQTVAFSLELFAIILGVILLIWGLRNQGTGTRLARIVGLFTSSFASLVLLYTLYYTLHYQSAGNVPGGNVIAQPTMKPVQFEGPQPITTPPSSSPPSPNSPSLQESPSPAPPANKPDNAWRPTHL